MRVSKNTLLGIAGVVWCIAGVNIVNIGLGAYGSLDKAAPGLVLALAAASVAVCALFWGKVFSKMLGKHVVRIQAMGDEAQPVWRFFDAKSYLIMAVMMGGGISLRAFNLVPIWFIAAFYTGLGVALAAAGAGFIVAFVRSGALVGARS